MLWDTSVFIDYLRNSTLAAYHHELVQTGALEGYCSVITEAELWAGNRDSEEELRAAAALSYFTVIPVDTNIARLAGNLLNRKSSGEKRAHFRDALIAATAIQQGETILTADRGSQIVFGDNADYLVYT